MLDSTLERVFIRRRTDPSDLQAPSYQVIGTYRDFWTGNLKERVIVNLGPYPDLRSALDDARRQLREQEERGASVAPRLRRRVRTLERLAKRMARSQAPATIAGFE
jgi:hypothetical protein